MRRILLAGVTLAVATVAAAGAADAAWVHRGFYGPRVFIGPSIGFGLYAPYYYPPVYYAPPPVVVQQGYAAAPAAPAPEAAAPAATPGYWYYCNNPQGYYPYVRQCDAQWQTVPANPAPGAPQ